MSDIEKNLYCGSIFDSIEALKQIMSSEVTIDMLEYMDIELVHLRKIVQAYLVYLKKGDKA